MSPMPTPRPERPSLGSALGVTPFQGWGVLRQRTWGCALRAPPQAVTSQAFSPSTPGSLRSVPLKTAAKQT